MSELKYKVLAPSLRVREMPSAAAGVRIIASLPRGAEFWADQVIVNASAETWARRIDERGRDSGWLMVSSATARHCERVALPLASNPPAAGADIEARVTRLEEWAHTVGME